MMKLTIQVKLTPDAVQAPVLERTLVAINEAANQVSKSDLLQRDGKWFLVATVDFPEPQVFEPLDWVGVDRGIVNLATTSDGDHHQGRRLGRYLRWQARKRAELQARNTRSATRRARRRAEREARHDGRPTAGPPVPGSVRDDDRTARTRVGPRLVDT